MPRTFIEQQAESMVRNNRLGDLGALLWDDQYLKDCLLEDALINGSEEMVRALVDVGASPWHNNAIGLLHAIEDHQPVKVQVVLTVPLPLDCSNPLEEFCLVEILDAAFTEGGATYAILVLVALQDPFQPILTALLSKIVHRSDFDACILATFLIRQGATVLRFHLQTAQDHGAKLMVKALLLNMHA